MSLTTRKSRVPLFYKGALHSRLSTLTLNLVHKSSKVTWAAVQVFVKWTELEVTTELVEKNWIEWRTSIQFWSAIQLWIFSIAQVTLYKQKVSKYWKSQIIWNFCPGSQKNLFVLCGGDLFPYLMSCHRVTYLPYTKTLHYPFTLEKDVMSTVIKKSEFIKLRCHKVGKYYKYYLSRTLISGCK